MVVAYSDSGTERLLRDNAGDDIDVADNAFVGEHFVSAANDNAVIVRIDLFNVQRGFGRDAEAFSLSDGVVDNAAVAS